MYIGIDLGGTNVRVASSKSLDKIEFVEIRRFELSHDFERDFNEIVKITKNISDGKVDGIGVGTPGTYNEDRTLLISGRNVLEWVEVPFLEKLSKKFNCPAFAENDAVVSSLSEAFYGQKDFDDFVYITWGTGIGGAFVEKKEGNIDSEKIDWHKYFEKFANYCGGKELAERYGKDVCDFDDKDWDEVMDEFEYYLLEVLDMIDHKNVVLGGGITERQKTRLQKVVNNLSEKGINLKISNFGHDGGLYGALALVKNKFK